LVGVDAFVLTAAGILQYALGDEVAAKLSAIHSFAAALAGLLWCYISLVA
jgi:hypothetical protein